MRRDIPLSAIIRELQKLPDSAKITVDTIKEVQVVGFVLKRTDNNKQNAEIVVPKQSLRCTYNISLAFTYHFWYFYNDA